MQEILDSHTKKIERMEETLKRIAPIIEQAEQREMKTLFWTKLNVCMVVASIFIKLFYIQL